jgi:hypothetical protein
MPTSYRELVPRILQQQLRVARSLDGHAERTHAAQSVIALLAVGG